MKTANKTLIAMVETSLNVKLVPAKSKKSDKHVVLSLSASGNSLKIVGKK